MTLQCRRHAPDRRGRGATADAIAVVRALRVVVTHEAIEGPLPGGRPHQMRDNDVAQERGGGRGIVGGQQAGQPVGAGRIARRDLPDFADAFEAADLERVQTHELAGLLRVDVPRPAVARTPQALPSACRQQPGGARRLLLEHGQPGSPRGQADPAQQPLPCTCARSMTRRRIPSSLSSRVIGPSSQSGSLGRVVTLGR